MLSRHRACYPESSITWTPVVPELCEFTDHHDHRRIRALLTDVLERASTRGDTLLSQAEAIELGNAYELIRPPALSTWLLEGLDLDSTSLASDPEAWPVVGVELAQQLPGLKLARFTYTADVIRMKIAELRGRPRHPDLTDARSLINAVLPPMPAGDDAEDRARAEKAAGLAELFASPLSVLIGPAGTGKTTLIKALVDKIGADRILLLAPTGKARVQLASKVGAQVTVSTLASYLSRTDRFDDAQRYLVLGEAGKREDVDLLVIDEASMLTEEMLASVLDAFRTIKRLVLVGDPRQLPPIGAGRPFVDLVTNVQPGSFAEPIHVAPSYVELRVPRRQVTAPFPMDVGETVVGSRADLDLAAWFGDGDLAADADLIWERLAADPDQVTVRYVSWSGRPVQEVLLEAIAAELDLTPISDAKGVDADEAAFALTYGATLNDGWVNWEVGAGETSEGWQILSPTRSRAAGSIELNRHIKRTYRHSELAQALRNSWNGTNLPSPIGPEQIIRGDKVMATRNNSRAKSWPAGAGLDYVANGEIGVGIGRRRKGKKSGLRLNVEFSSQPGAQYGYWTSSKEDPALELAWAVTVHKSQGSEFGLTFLVLPARSNASRELLYTALTRQRKRVVIIYEGTLAELRELSHPWLSETARRLTDLFEAPNLVTVDPGQTGRPQRYDGRILHVTAGGTVVKSKNEVIVAGVLDEVAPARWTYETPLTGSDGRTLHPDFTVQRADGSLVLWEHLGLMGDPDYARKWALKRDWYEANGFPEHPKRGEKGTLMCTDDRGGVDLPSWQALAEEVIGPLASGPKRRGPGRRRNR